MKTREIPLVFMMKITIINVKNQNIIPNRVQSAKNYQKNEDFIERIQNLGLVLEFCSLD